MGLDNFYYFINDPYFIKDFINTLVLVLSVLVITVVGGVFLAMLLDQPFWGRGIVRVLMISPFFIMPTVSSLVWKNLIMHPVFGLFAAIQRFFGATEVFDWFGTAPLISVIIIVAWQWLPYAALILLTSLQSLDEEQKAASQMDGAGPVAYFRYIVLPHLSRPITVVILIETIFLLNIFAEIKVTSVGGFAGNLTYLVFSQLNDATDVGEAAAGGLIAVVLGQSCFDLPRPHRGPEPGELIMAQQNATRRKVAFTILAWALGILMFFPIFWTAVAAFKTESDAYTLPQNWLSTPWTLENFGIVQERSDYVRYIINTLVIAGLSTILGLHLCGSRRLVDGLCACPPSPPITWSGKRWLATILGHRLRCRPVPLCGAGLGPRPAMRRSASSA